MIYAVIGIVCLIAGLFFMLKFLMSSPSLKKRDEHSEKNPWDDTFFPPNN